MDRPPKKLPNSSSRLIAMAVNLSGDARHVQNIMKCTDEDFLQYRESRKNPTWPELDRLIALIVREQSQVIERNRELLARIRARKPRNPGS